MTLQEMREARAKLATEMRQLHDLAEKEDRGFSTDEDEKWAKMNADIEALDARIEREERLGGLEDAGHTSLPGVGTQRTEPREPDTPEVNHGEAFRSFLVNGISGLTPEQRQVMQASFRSDPEMRAFSAGTDNTGGYTVPEDFYNQLEVAMQAYGGMLEAGDIIRTDSGATMPMPTFNYTGVAASILSENTQASSDSSTPFGVVNLDAYMYVSPILPVSYQFLQDSAFGEGFLADALGESLGRGLNAHLTTGTGSSQPNGIVTAATLGKTGATGQTATVTYDDLIDLVHSVDPAYRPQARWMFHDSTLKVVKKLKDDQSRPLWLPGLATGDPDTINGYTYVINQSMASMAANAKSILFGALDKYKVRIVRDVSMLRLTERYADYLQVGFIAFMRADGDLLDAGTNPVKYYANSAT